jgi:hypothetical protein
MEYSLSASVMHIQLGLLSGITDVHLLWFIGILIASTMACAAITDYLLAFISKYVNVQNIVLHQRVFYSGFTLGWIGFLGAWSVIACYFCFAAINNQPPIFVWVIMVVVLGLDLSFAGVYWRQQHQPHLLACDIHYEQAFLFLSLVSKQSLAWILFQGSRAVEFD